MQRLSLAAADSLNLLQRALASTRILASRALQAGHLQNAFLDAQHDSLGRQGASNGSAWSRQLAVGLSAAAAAAAAAAFFKSVTKGRFCRACACASCSAAATVPPVLHSERGTDSLNVQLLREWPAAGRRAHEQASVQTNNVRHRRHRSQAQSSTSLTAKMSGGSSSSSSSTSGARVTVRVVRPAVPCV